MMAIPASLLFVPGNMPDRFAKALATDAAMVCLDLEDAVSPQDKARARGEVLAHVAASGQRDRLCVRVNRLGSMEGCEDLAALARAERLPAALMLPKVEAARDAELFAAALAAPPPLIALVESPRGLEDAAEIARCPAVAALMFGSFDYAAETGCSQDWDVLVPVRSRLVAAASAAGKPLIDSPFADLADAAGNAREAVDARRLGCAGKAAIHPRMIAGIEAAFTPREAEIREALAIVSAFRQASGGVARIGGKLVERPVVLRMEELLLRADMRRTGRVHDMQEKLA